MSATKYIIRLTDAERKTLKAIITKGLAPARQILRANILLASDQNSKKCRKVSEIADVLGTTTTTVRNVKISYLKNGLKATISRKKRVVPPIPRKVTAKVEKQIIELASSKPPRSYARWSLRLLAKQCVELHIIKSISHSTIARLLKNK